MPSTATPSPIDLETPTRPGPRPQFGGSGGGPRKPIDQRGWGGDSGGGDGFSSGDRLKLAVWIAIGAILMFFAAIASAMVIRRVGPDWRTLDLPNALWFSTALLLLSSATFEIAKRRLRRGATAELRRWITVTAALGLGFILAQLVGWLELLQRNVSVGWNPSSSFFYLLTAAHGAHVLGGLAVLGYAVYRIWRPEPWRNRGPLVEAASLYWHFMDALWLFLLLLLVVWG